MSSDTERGYKRLHVFKAHLGADDWIAREDYRWTKHQLHGFQFHNHGIVPEHTGELTVVQRKRGEMAVIVQPGFAVDHNGLDMILNETQEFEISREEYYLPCTLYLVLRYRKVPDVMMRLKDGSRRNKYFAEDCFVEILTEEPDTSEVELCRIRLSEDVYKITDARNPQKPRVNEIDLTQRRYATIYRGLDPELRLELLLALRARKEAYLKVGGNRLLRPAASISHCISVMEMVVKADMLTRPAALTLLEGLNMLDLVVGNLIRDYSLDPWVLERPEWKALEKNSGVVRSLLDGPRHYRMENFDSIISFLAKANDHFADIARIYGDDSLIFYEGQAPVLAREYPLGDDWERIKAWSAEFPEILYIDGLTWRRVSELNITDEKSEKRHKFKIHNAIDAWRQRQNLMFPDGSEVQDTGVAHEGGYSEYEVRGIIPDTHLAVIRMMDYVRADYELEFVVNDQLAGVSQCLGHDRRYRWRNWPFVIPAWFVNDDVVRIKQIMTTAERDVNMFRYWFYQPIDF